MQGSPHGGPQLLTNWDQACLCLDQRLCSLGGQIFGRRLVVDRCPVVQNNGFPFGRSWIVPRRDSAKWNPAVKTWLTAWWPGGELNGRRVGTAPCKRV